MAQLSGNKIKDTYAGLLKTTDNAALDATLKNIEDGDGNTAPLQMSTSAVNFTGTVTGDNNTTYDFAVIQDAANAELQLNGSDLTTDPVTLIAGSNITLTVADSDVTIEAADSDTTYDLASAQNVSDVDITLSGSDATSDVIKLVAGTNITLTDNGANQVTIDAAGGGGAGVDSLNTLTGGLTLSAGTGISISDNGSDTITVTATGGGGGGTLQAQSIQTLPPIKGSVVAGNSYRTGLPVVNYNLNTMSSASSGNRCYWSIMPLGEGQTLSKIQFFVRSGLASATSNASIGIYSLTTDSAGELILGDLLRTVSTAIDVTTDGGKNVDFSSNPFTMPSGQTYGAVGIMLGINDTAEAFTAAGWNNSVFDSVWSNGTSSINGTLVSRVLATYYDAWNGTLPATASTTAYASQTYYPLALLAQ